MIREARFDDVNVIAGIDVAGSRYAYKGILTDEYLYNELTVEARIPVYQRWISEKRFELYVYEDDKTGSIM